MSLSDPSRRLLLRLGALAPLALAGCTALPQPFRGRPGELARRLRQPPGYRIAVPSSSMLLLTDEDSASLSRAFAQALVASEVPAVAGPGLPLDWQLVAAAERQADQVVPRYALRDADGQALGMLIGQPVPAREWVEGGAPLHARLAAETVPRLATLVGRIDAQRRTGDERAVGAGPPVLRLLPVRGAPGDGNRSLTARMRERLATLGFQVQEEAQGAQFAVQGEVSVVPSRPGQQRVEIVWIVSRRDGEDLGRVLQLNEVPTGTLRGLWGDVAYVVAQEASGGVRDVVFNAGGFPAPAEAARPPA
ncbi:hypothetical protein [Falsiroseomonas sp. E2-1-a20]|uniref:hypothetical protein n=1 Tax=Falsiroseomonas sp. E2-1-a20 TaxID=3239300 RepID=UPI003F34FC8F